MPVKLSVIIPAYNESLNLRAGVLDAVYNYLKQKSISFEVIVVDDGSCDETAGLVAEFIKTHPHLKLIKNSHLGKALTVVTGMLEAEGEIALFTDMDQATPIDQLEKILPKFDQGFDVVIGTRHGRKGAPMRRKLTAWGFTLLRDILLGLPYRDTQCGFKAFDQKAIRTIFPLLKKFRQGTKTSGAAVNAGFDIELLYIAKKKNLKITDVNVDWHYVGSERVPFIKSSLDAIFDIIRIKANSLTGAYD